MCDFWQADTVNLLVKYYKEARHGIYLSNEEDEVRGKRNENKVSQSIQKSLNVRMMEVKSKTREALDAAYVLIPFQYKTYQSLCSFAVMRITRLVL